MQVLAGTITTNLTRVKIAFSRRGESYGQHIPIHNCTPFTLQLRNDKTAVICGKESTTPSAIEPNTNRYIQNCGLAGYANGSEIWYTYRFENTPGEPTWYLKIFSEGTIPEDNSRFAIQIFREDEMMARESLWDTKKRQFPSHWDSGCLFRISVLSPTKPKYLGAGFNKIPVKIQVIS